MVDAIPAAQILTNVLLGGLLGIIGQGARVVVGLKKAQEAAIAQNIPLSQVFVTSTLMLSLMIGFIAGGLAAISLGEKDWTPSTEMLLGLIAAGYAGTDFIEGLASKYLPKQASTPAPQPNPGANPPAPPGPGQGGGGQGGPNQGGAGQGNPTGPATPTPQSLQNGSPGTPASTGVAESATPSTVPQNPAHTGSTSEDPSKPDKPKKTN